MLPILEEYSPLIGAHEHIEEDCHSECGKEQKMPRSTRKIAKDRLLPVGADLECPEGDGKEGCRQDQSEDSDERDLSFYVDQTEYLHWIETR